MDNIVFLSTLFLNVVLLIIEFLYNVLSTNISDKKMLYLYNGLFLGLEILLFISLLIILIFNIKTFSTRESVIIILILLLCIVPIVFNSLRLYWIKSSVNQNELTSNMSKHYHIFQLIRLIILLIQYTFYNILKSKK